MIPRAVRTSQHSFTGRSWKLPVIKKNENQPAPIMTAANPTPHTGRWGSQGTVDGLQEKRNFKLCPLSLLWGKFSRFTSGTWFAAPRIASPRQGDGAKIRIFSETCSIAG